MIWRKSPEEASPPGPALTRAAAPAAVARRSTTGTDTGRPGQASLGPCRPVPRRGVKDARAVTIPTPTPPQGPGTPRTTAPRPSHPAPSKAPGRGAAQGHRKRTGMSPDPPSRDARHVTGKPSPATRDSERYATPPVPEYIGEKHPGATLLKKYEAQHGAGTPEKQAVPRQKAGAWRPLREWPGGVACGATRRRVPGARGGGPGGR